MIDMLLALGLAGAIAGDDDDPPTVYAKDATRAARLEVEDPATQICVRMLMTGSRTRWSKRCMTSDQWKNYELEKRELGEAIQNVKGINDRNYNNGFEPK